MVIGCAGRSQHGVCGERCNILSARAPVAFPCSVTCAYGTCCTQLRPFADRWLARHADARVARWFANIVYFRRSALVICLGSTALALPRNYKLRTDTCIHIPRVSGGPPPAPTSPSILVHNRPPRSGSPGQQLRRTWVSLGRSKSPRSMLTTHTRASTTTTFMSNVRRIPPSASSSRESTGV